VWSEGAQQGRPGAGATWTAHNTGLPWSTAGGSRTTQLFGPVTPSITSGAEVMLPLDAAVVQRWIDAGSANYGLFVASSIVNVSTHYHFGSTETPIMGARPELTLVLSP
jgi:hypothetical protein